MAKTKSGFMIVDEKAERLMKKLDSIPFREWQPTGEGASLDYSTRVDYLNVTVTEFSSLIIQRGKEYAVFPGEPYTRERGKYYAVIRNLWKKIHHGRRPEDALHSQMDLMNLLSDI